LVNKFFHRKVRAHLVLEIRKFTKQIDNESSWRNNLDYETAEKEGLISYWHELKFVCEQLWFTPEFSQYVAANSHYTDIYLRTDVVFSDNSRVQFVNELWIGGWLIRFFSHFYLVSKSYRLLSLKPIRRSNFQTLRQPQLCNSMVLAE
jgi:hypothetical protein